MLYHSVAGRNRIIPGLGGFGDVLRRCVLAGVLAVAALSLGGLASASARTVTIGGPFELVRDDGAIVTDADFRGDWLLILFGYTFCPDFCPMTLAVVAEALETLGDDAERVRPIFISVDPDRDTPDVLAAYTAAFDARIVGLTGSPEQISAVADAYGAYYKAHKQDETDQYYLVDHSVYLYVVDPEGDFVQVMEHGASGDDIAETLRNLMRLR